VTPGGNNFFNDFFPDDQISCTYWLEIGRARLSLARSLTHNEDDGRKMTHIQPTMDSNLQMPFCPWRLENLSPIVGFRWH